jgi:hypothetical protein
MEVLVADSVGEVGERAQIVGVEVPERHVDGYERATGYALRAHAAAPAAGRGVREDLLDRGRQRR